MSVFPIFHAAALPVNYFFLSPHSTTPILHTNRTCQPVALKRHYGDTPLPPHHAPPHPSYFPFPFLPSYFLSFSLSAPFQSIILPPFNRSFQACTAIVEKLGYTQCKVIEGGIDAYLAAFPLTQADKVKWRAQDTDGQDLSVLVTGVDTRQAGEIYY